ncbi:MAG: class IV adenylate cyclase [Candidatus Woesearchaeota archaeon]
MANNTEVEVKVQIDAQIAAKLKARLKEIAIFGKIAKQKDEYYTPAHRSFVEPEYPFEWLSIRQRGEITILNYKHFHPENAQVHTHCEEYETEVANPEQLRKIFISLDVKKLVTIEKERETYLYKDEFEVAIDKVKELGFYVEIEAKKDFGSVSAARKKIGEFAKSIELDISSPDLRGYPYLLMEKKGLLEN